MGPEFVIEPPYSGDKNVSGSMVFIAYGLVSNIPKRNDVAGVDFKGSLAILGLTPQAFAVVRSAHYTVEESQSRKP